MQDLLYRLIRAAMFRPILNKLGFAELQLVVSGGGQVYLRNEVGGLVSQGDLRDGMVYWSNGKRSWLAREGPGVLVGDVDTGKHFYFRRNG